MSKRASFAALVAVLILGIATLSFGPGASVAQAQGEEFDVTVQLEGVVVEITAELFTLDDDGQLVDIVLTDATIVGSGVAVGASVTVFAHLDDIQFVADAVFLAGDEGPYQLNLGSVSCVNGTVGVHFVLLNVPDDIAPGNLDYTYGAGITPQSNTGNVWHYWAFLPSGTYSITGATVTVDGQVVSLHNPGAYAGDYNCGATPEPTDEPTEEPTLVADCAGLEGHPVASRLADAFDVPYAEIMNWHCMGIGFGEIARAYALQDITAEDEEPLFVEALFDRRLAGEGWGNIVKDSGVAPNRLAPGQVKHLNDDVDGDDNDEGDEELLQQQLDDDDDQDERPGNSGNAPGQNKDDRGNQGNRGNSNSNRGGRGRR